MPARAFSIEDGNLGNKTITTARTVGYQDIDLSFTKKPSGDMTIPPLEKSGGGSSAFDPKPVEAMPKDRK